MADRRLLLSSLISVGLLLALPLAGMWAAGVPIAPFLEFPPLTRRVQHAPFAWPVFFWELWNYYSLAKWEYAIPYVHRFEIFEMPLPGYAGYLPFGLECTLAANLVEDLLSRRSRPALRRD